MGGRAALLSSSLLLSSLIPTFFSLLLLSWSLSSLPLLSSFPSFSPFYFLPLLSSSPPLPALSSSSLTSFSSAPFHPPLLSFPSSSLPSPLLPSILPDFYTGHERTEITSISENKGTIPFLNYFIEESQSRALDFGRWGLGCCSQTPPSPIF